MPQPSPVIILAMETVSHCVLPMGLYDIQSRENWMEVPCYSIVYEIIWDANNALWSNIPALRLTYTANVTYNACKARSKSLGIWHGSK